MADEKNVEKALKDVTKNIKLEGVIVNHSIETEGSWKIRLETTKLRRLGLYEVFMEQLRLVLTTMDSAWSELAKERNLHKDEQFLKEEGKAKPETRITKDYVEFVVLPQALVNSIKYIRTLVYDAINKYAVKVPLSTEMGEGDMKVKQRTKFLYVVPRSLFADLSLEINKINDYVDALNHRVGKISQINEEEEIGKYSMEDFFHSPYFQKLRNLSVSILLLQDIADKDEFKNLIPKVKKEIVAVVANGGDVKPVLDKYVKDKEFKNYVVKQYERHQRFFDLMIRHYIRPVSMNPLFIDMSPERIDEWLREDPELARKVREQARGYVKALVEQLVMDASGALEKVRKNIKRYAKAGASRAIVEELGTLANKFKALGVSTEDMEALTGRLAEGEQDADELLNLTYKVDDMLDSFVRSAGAEMGEVAGEESAVVSEEEAPGTGAVVMEDEENEAEM